MKLLTFMTDSGLHIGVKLERGIKNKTLKHLSKQPVSSGNRVRA